MRNPGKVSLGLIVGLFLMLAGLRLGHILLQATPHQPPPIHAASATLLPELRPLPPFSLIDHQGGVYDNQRLYGHWTLLYFGYTHCPDICPTNLALLARMKARLQQDGLRTPLEIGFVSIDPPRDTPGQLAGYVTYFDPEFVGITGLPQAIAALTGPLGILYRKVETADSAMGYVMDHADVMVLLDPEARYFALFSQPHDAAIMARDILAITRSSGE